MSNHTEYTDGSKELLEATVKGIQAKIVDLNNDLKDKQHELENVNKPVMTGEMYDVIFEAIEEGISYFDFDDSNNFTFDFEIDNDNRIDVSGVEFSSGTELNESIMSKIEEYFKIPHIEQ